MSRLRQHPWYLLLFPILFYALDYSKYVHTINYKELVLNIAYFYGVILVLYLIGQFVFPKKQATWHVISFCALLFYCFFGPIKSALNSIGFLKPLSSYTVLLPLFILAIAGLAFFLFRRKRPIKQLQNYLSFVTLVLLAVQFVPIVRNVFTQKWQDLKPVSVQTDSIGQKENVYFILFDEYCGDKQLNDWYGRVNTDRNTFFDERGIYHKDISSNYNWTMLSMNSMFNLQYIDKQLLHPWNEYELYLKSYRYIGDNKVFNFFKEADYKCHSYSPFHIDNLAQHQHMTNQYSAVGVMNKKMLHKVIYEEVLWHFIVGKFKTDYMYEKYYLYHFNKNKATVNETLRLAREKNKQQFVYAHLLLPHQPYQIDSTGKVLDFDTERKEVGTLDAYLNNYIFSTNYIKTFYDSIIHYDPKSTIILCGDHGFRYMHDSVHQYAFNTMFSMHTPEEQYDQWDSVNSLVNVFPNLLNKQFNQNIPLLKDSTFFMDEETNRFFSFPKK